MAPSGKGSKIVRYWTAANAPTGESGRWQTADGAVWKETWGPFENVTGVRYGYVENDRIVPKE